MELRTQPWQPVSRSKLNLAYEWMGFWGFGVLGLNVSNRQIAKELNVSEKTAQSMTDKLRTQVEKNNPDVMLSGEVELDEVYVVAGHKGYPEALKKRVEVAVGED